MDFAMKENQLETQQQKLFRLLDKGIEDMEQGNELLLHEAFQRIREVREQRKYEKV